MRGSGSEMLDGFFKYVQKYDVFLHYPELDMDSLYVRGYADASFGMNVDGSTKLVIASC
jgi:hypothetical protein